MLLLRSCKQVVGVGALACGMISVGTCNGEVTSTILQTMMERSETELKETYSRYLALGLALAMLGKFPEKSVNLFIFGGSLLVDAPQP